MEFMNRKVFARELLILWATVVVAAVVFFVGPFLVERYNNEYLTKYSNDRDLLISENKQGVDELEKTFENNGRAELLELLNDKVQFNAEAFLNDLYSEIPDQTKKEDRKKTLRDRLVRIYTTYKFEQDSLILNAYQKYWPEEIPSMPELEKIKQKYGRITKTEMSDSEIREILADYKIDENKAEINDLDQRISAIRANNSNKSSDIFLTSILVLLFVVYPFRAIAYSIVWSLRTLKS
jgi:hypothetical protein